MTGNEISVTPREADRVVRHEKNQMYNPAVSTTEVADELDVSVERARELLESAPRPESKEVGNTRIWW